jgi:biotin synthase
VRTIAIARILMPKSYVRLSAGRQELGDGIQALCFLAGANSIFYGEKLLTTGNPEADADRLLMQRLGLNAQEVSTTEIDVACGDVTHEGVTHGHGGFSGAQLCGSPLSMHAGD